MGTNFYFKTGRKHIGKRSAAGLYCWDCGITLCKQGPKGIHSGHSEWYDKCPECGKEPVKETLTTNSAGRELGFNKAPAEKKRGVATCSSFTWAISRVDLEKKRMDVKIVNEYGDSYYKYGFMDLLSECPIQFTHMIGQKFS